VIARHHEHVVETLQGARIGPTPLLAAQAVGLAAHLLGSVTACAPLAPLEVLVAATSESPASPALMPSLPQIAGKTGNKF
jgi:hypothetical protein